MNLSSHQTTSVFADWLDVTCSPERSFLSDVQYALDSFGASISDASPLDNLNARAKLLYQLGSGTVSLQRNKYFHKIGLSGAALRHIRSLGKLDFLLGSIGSVPHSITRLDCAVDVAMDGALTFAHYEKLFSKPERYPKLTRKTVKPSYFSSIRESDGKRTGTVNIGAYRNTKVSARIYDKQAEALDKRGEELPPTTRFELTVRKDMKPSLRDVSEPTAIFWHYMGRTLLKTPEGVPEWIPGWGGEWTMVVEKPLVYQVVKSKIETNPELIRIFELADSMSPDGRDIAINMIKRMYSTSSQKQAEG